MVAASLLKSIDWHIFEGKLRELSFFPDVTLKHFITNTLSLEELNLVFNQTQYFIQLLDDNLTYPLASALKKLDPKAKALLCNEYFQKDGFLSIEELNELILSVEVIQELLSYDQNPLL